jgi:hypothetical protein
MAKTKVKGKAKAKALKPKRTCCKDRPRCKRCPVVLKRLEKAGLAERRDDGRFRVDPDLTKRELKAARVR